MQRSSNGRSTRRAPYEQIFHRTARLVGESSLQSTYEVLSVTQQGEGQL
jgi:hypothetical protein